MSDHADADACSIEAEGDARAATLRLRGTLDEAGGRLLESALRRELRAGRRDLAVDLAGCTALDAEGIAALERAGELVHRVGGLLRLNHASPAVRAAVARPDGDGRQGLRIAPGSSAQQRPGARASSSTDSTQLLRHLFVGIPADEQPRLVELLSRDAGRNGARLDPVSLSPRRRRPAPRAVEEA